MRGLQPLPDSPRYWYGPEDVGSGFRLADVRNNPASCPTCAGKGSFRFYADWTLGPRQEGQEIVEYECPCWEQALLYRWFKIHGIGERIGQHYLGDLWQVEPDVQAETFEYLELLDGMIRRGQGRLIYGKSGNGKTTIAALLLKACAAKMYSVYWTTFITMLDMYTAGFGSREDKAWFDHQVRSADILVLDDLGKEYVDRKIRRSAFDDLLHTRSQAGRTTIITTNLDEDELLKHYESALGSLLNEVCPAVHLTGLDWRGEARKQVAWEIKNEITRPYTFGFG